MYGKWDYINNVNEKGLHENVYTVGWFLVMWFNNCILGKSGQIVDPLIAEFNPIQY